MTLAKRDKAALEDTASCDAAPIGLLFVRDGCHLGSAGRALGPGFIGHSQVFASLEPSRLVNR